MKKKNLVVIVALVLVVTVGITLAVSTYQKYVDVVFTVIDSKDGIEVYPDPLNFGCISRNSNKTAVFHVKNLIGEPLDVSIIIPGNLGGWSLKAEPDTFILQPFSEQNVTVTLSVSTMPATGNHTVENYISVYANPTG